MYISEIRTKAPADERMPLERKFYDILEKLKIPYEQVDNDPASSMESEEDDILLAGDAGR